MSDLLDLKNGSDIRGIALATDEYKANLTPEVMENIAWGLVNWFREQKTGPLVVGIGRDSRITGPNLAATLTKVFVTQEITVIDFGLATTPAMFIATQFPEFACDFALMLTASHLPYYYNGVKIFAKSGGAEKSDIEYILTHPTTLAPEIGGKSQQADLLPSYSDFLVQKIRDGLAPEISDQEQPLKGLKILVDAGNGAGGFFASQVLQPLGADTTGSQFLEPDGYFPNHVLNPLTIKKASESIQPTVLTHQKQIEGLFSIRMWIVLG